MWGRYGWAVDEADGDEFDADEFVPEPCVASIGLRVICVEAFIVSDSPYAPVPPGGERNAKDGMTSGRRPPVDGDEALLNEMLDGRLDDASVQLVKARLEQEPALASLWRELTRVSDVTRRMAPTGTDLDAPVNFADGVRARIASEPARSTAPATTMSQASSTSGVRSGDGQFATDQAASDQVRQPQSNQPKSNQTTSKQQQPRALRFLTLAYVAAALLMVGWTLHWAFIANDGDNNQSRQVADSSRVAESIQADETSNPEAMKASGTPKASKGMKDSEGLNARRSEMDLGDTASSDSKSGPAELRKSKKERLHHEDFEDAFADPADAKASYESAKPSRSGEDGVAASPVPRTGASGMGGVGAGVKKLEGLDQLESKDGRPRRRMLARAEEQPAPGASSSAPDAPKSDSVATLDDVQNEIEARAKRTMASADKGQPRPAGSPTESSSGTGAATGSATGAPAATVDTESSSKDTKSAGANSESYGSERAGRVRRGDGGLERPSDARDEADDTPSNRPAHGAGRARRKRAARDQGAGDKGREAPPPAVDAPFAPAAPKIPAPRADAPPAKSAPNQDPSVLAPATEAGAAPPRAASKSKKGGASLPKGAAQPQARASSGFANTRAPDTVHVFLLEVDDVRAARAALLAMNALAMKKAELERLGRDRVIAGNPSVVPPAAVPSTPAPRIRRGVSLGDVDVSPLREAPSSTEPVRRAAPASSWKRRERRTLNLDLAPQALATLKAATHTERELPEFARTARGMVLERRIKDARFARRTSKSKAASPSRAPGANRGGGVSVRIILVGPEP